MFASFIWLILGNFNRLWHQLSGGGGKRAAHIFLMAVESFDTRAEWSGGGSEGCRCEG